MPTAEIIAIGTELLLGEIQDTNTCTLARYLRSLGIDLYRTTTVGDNVKRIAAAVSEAHARSDIVITTGGLGPTVDDPTREAIALAVEKQLLFDEQLWQTIQKRFERYGRVATENNRRQAYIPEAAIPVNNNVGTAPAFLVQNGFRIIISLPGVPKELEYIFETEIIPLLRTHFKLSDSLYIHTIHIAGAGESQIDELIGDLELLENPTVGLVANAGQIDIRITTKAPSSEAAETLYNPVYETIKARLGDSIIGIDDDNLVNLTLTSLHHLAAPVTIMCEGFTEKIGQIFSRTPLLATIGKSSDGKIIIQANHNPENPGNVISGLLLKAALHRLPENCVFESEISTQHQNQSHTRSYGGPPAMAEDWAINSLLDQIRRTLR